MKRIKLFEILIYLTFFVSIISYEIHIYSNFKFAQILLFCLSFFSFIVFIKNDDYFNKFIININKEKLPIILSVFMILSSLICCLIFNENSILTPFIVIMFAINILFYFYALPIYLEYNGIFKEHLYKFLFFTIFVIINLGIIIYLKKEFLGYSLEYGRARSIYFDPNFFAVISTISFILFLSKNKKKLLKIIILLLSFVIIALSGSRGTMLSLALSLLYYVIIKFPNKYFYKKIIIIIVFSLCIYFVYDYLSSIDFFRLYQGSGGRLEMIKFSFHIIKESPIFGFGYGSIDSLLRSHGYMNASTHNSLADFMLGYGIPSTIVFLILIVKTWFISIKKRTKVYSSIMFVFLFFNMNTILYSFGGVGFPSIMFTLFLGILFYGGKSKDDKIEYNYSRL